MDITRKRQFILWVVLLVLVIGIGGPLIRNRVAADKTADNLSNRATLVDKINPNTASWGSLARLPGIGEGKARAIVAYREEMKGTGVKERVFNTGYDLSNVKGIGPKTVEKVESYLECGGAREEDD